MSLNTDYRGKQTTDKKKTSQDLKRRI
ncbi:hypothetical protein F383_11820 [Gossypium arboreum]|uniref:Uncharacterized protein n=1 Tax=Gossypium arboreum TaxID=29729 RepID=A0A0B0PSA4_GOSAR|nr:hypothetical protein F383_11820 [Gossypium arboreum]